MSENSKIIRALLITRGRKSGKEHSVMLRGVLYEDKVYFSRHRPNSDWFQNAVFTPHVKIEFDGQTHSGKAVRVTDKRLETKISHLKYPGEARSNEKRVAIEIVLES